MFCGSRYHNYNPQYFRSDTLRSGRLLLVASQKPPVLENYPKRPYMKTNQILGIHTKNLF